MHHAFVLGSKRKTCGFGEGKCIIVGTESHTIAVGVDAAPNHGHNTRFAYARLGLQPHVAETVGHKGHSAELLLAELRMAVEVTAPANHLRAILTGIALDYFNNTIHNR